MIGRCRFGPPPNDPLTSTADQIFREYHTVTNDIKQSGHHVGGNALQPTLPLSCW